MPWSWVVGQERAVDILRRSVAGGRVAHAYLFHGPEGSGKRVAALAFAQALQCNRRDRDASEACGDCEPCRKVQRFVHPDVQMHLALPSSHQVTSDERDPPRSAYEDVAARMALLVVDPYAEVGYHRRPDLSDPSKSANLRPFYSVERLRSQINPSLRFAPSEGRYKVAIVVDADTMRAEAANTFLKILEEPNPATVLILTATRADRLLPTITSRCQRVRFDPVGSEDIEGALLTRGLGEGGAARMLARMANGSVTTAISLAADEQLLERRNQIVAFLRAAGQGVKGFETLDRIIADWSSLGREPLRHVLTLMLSWIRDLVITRASNGQAQVINVDQEESIGRFVENLPQARLDSMVEVTEHAVELVATNVNLELVLINLGDGLRAAMKGKERNRLFEQLVG